MFREVIVLACLLAVANARYIDNFNFNLSTLTSRIIGGHNAKRGEFPHQVSLQVMMPQEIPYTHFCGGSIINERWIITAAHCLTIFDNALPGFIFAVVSGKHDLSVTEDTEQTSQVEKFFIHKQYDREPKYKVGPYDIGLIKLKTPFQLNKHVVAIKLPKENSEPQGPVTLSGWGAVDQNSVDSKMPQILQTINLTIVDRKTCNNAVHKLYEQQEEALPDDLVDKTNICSGPLTGGKSACSGDSGGPLINRDKNGNAELIGIVSWGLEPCGSNGAPSVYTRTSYFIEWIDKVMTEN